MKKFSLFFAALMVSAMTFAADAVVTSTFLDNKWKVGTNEPEWTATGAEANAFDSQNSRGVQITLTKIQTSGLTLTNDSIKNMGAGIKKVDIIYSSNCSGSSDGTISVKVGETTFGSTYTIANEKNATISFSNTTAVKGDINIIFTSSASTKSVYVKSITVTYEKNQTLDPTISANTLDMQTFVVGVSQTKTLTVSGENLNDAITYEWEKGGLFSATGSLTKDGGELSINVVATTDTIAEDSLILTSGTTVSKVVVKANVVVLNGTGTKEDPFSVKDVIKLNNTLKGNYWVNGVILGCAGQKGVLASGDYGATNLLLGETSTDSVGVPVELKSKSAISNGINLKSFPENVGKTLLVYGSLEAYFSVPGVKSPSDYEISSTPTSLIETTEKASVQKIMENGRVVIIRDGKRYDIVGKEL